MLKINRFLTVLTVLISALFASHNARAIEFGIFDAHTIYTLDKTGFKDKVLLVFHGLGSAQPNGTFRRLEKKLSGDYSVVGVNYDYTDVIRNKRELADLWDRYLTGHKVFVIGTSLGGFWADYFANTYGISRMVLVNPVTDPITDMQQFLGDRYSEKRQLNYHISDQDLLNYSKINTPINPKTKSLVFLTEDDPVIDHKSALQKYSNNKNSQIIIHKTGGHSLPLSDPLYLSVLKVFLETK